MSSSGSSNTQQSQPRRSKRLASKTSSKSESNPISGIPSTNSLAPSTTSTNSSFRNIFGHCISVDAPELDNKYNIIDVIGYGGYATVYKARDLSGNLVAIKRISAANIRMKYAYTDNHPCIEIQVMLDTIQCTNFPQIKKVLVDQDTGSFSIIMNFFEHKEFKEYVSTLNEREVIEYIETLLISIHELDVRGYVHRDIKATNYLFNPMGKTKEERYMLIDFGLVQLQTEISREFHKEEKSKSHRSTVNVNIPKTCKPLKTRSIIPSTNQRHKSSKRRRKNRMSDFHIGPWALNKEKEVPQVIRDGTPGWRAPEVILQSNDQDSRIDVFNAGLLLGCIMMGCTSMFSPKDDMQQLLQFIPIYGWDTVKSTAKALGRDVEIRGFSKGYLNDNEYGEEWRVDENGIVTGFEHGVQGKSKLSHWIKERIQCLQGMDGKENMNSYRGKGLQSREWSDDLYDLLDGLTQFNPKHRLTPEAALQHRVFQK